MFKKAFTLIELLVVIAIIAILAAILFPVFAQAKLAAKGAVTLSNAKQITLAHLIYANDYDDTFVPSVCWNTGNDPVWFGSPGTAFSPWGWTLLPYMKSTGIFEDAQASPAVSDPQYNTLVMAMSPQFGYDYTVLSPFFTNDFVTFTVGPISNTSLNKPSETVMLATRANPMLTQGGAWTTWLYSLSSTNGDNGPLTFGTVEAPDCNDIVPACFTNWGTGEFWAGWDNNNVVEGDTTGLVAGRGPNFLASASWADGHASKKNFGALAVGTTWTPVQPTNLVKVTDMSKYLWTAN